MVPAYWITSCVLYFTLSVFGLETTNTRECRAVHQEWQLERLIRRRCDETFDKLNSGNPCAVEMSVLNRSLVCVDQARDVHFTCVPRGPLHNGWLCVQRENVQTRICVSKPQGAVPSYSVQSLPLPQGNDNSIDVNQPYISSVNLSLTEIEALTHNQCFPDEAPMNGLVIACIVIAALLLTSLLITFIFVMAWRQHDCRVAWPWKRQVSDYDNFADTGVVELQEPVDARKLEFMLDQLVRHQSEQHTKAKSKAQEDQSNLR